MDAVGDRPGGARVGLAVASPGLAQEGPWYVSGSLGGYFRQAVSGPDSFYHGDDPADRVGGTDRIDFDHSALTGAVALGRRFAGRFRVEAELGYTRYGADTLRPFTAAPGFPALTVRRSSARAGTTTPASPAR